MNIDNLPTPTWSGSFTVFGVEVKCHVLDNGERIIEKESMAALLSAMGDSGSNDGDGFLEFVSFCKNGTASKWPP